MIITEIVTIVTGTVSVISLIISTISIFYTRKQFKFGQTNTAINEIQTLYAARYTNLESKYAMLEFDVRAFKTHAEKCEEELAALKKISGH